MAVMNLQPVCSYAHASERTMPTVKSAIRHLALLFMVLCPTLVRAEDLVEFLNGAKARGKVLEIRTDQKEFDLEVQV